MHDNGLKISRVVPGGIADQLGITSGDVVTRINDIPVRDILDYRFLATGEYLELHMTTGDGQYVFEIEKEYDERLGIEFETPFPGLRKCGNRCLFCFVDQMPPGMRPSLYIKDDDYRLSFWDGNFITLTNLRDAERKRIVAQRLSPLFISVHTTNPALRRRMMGNQMAGEILEQLEFLADNAIEFHTQIVLCPGLNDGDELERTLTDLGGLLPSVLSIAVVPVGRTRYRDQLYPLRAFTPEEASGVIRRVEKWQERFTRVTGVPLVYAGDEFYIQAGIEVPPADLYAGFPQLENGVGLVRMFLDEWDQIRQTLPGACKPLKVTVITGRIASGVLTRVTGILDQLPGLDVTLVPVENRFFGKDVTAAGLLTGTDILAALEDRNPGDLVVVPAATLKDNTVFLDDLSLEELGQRLGVKVAAAAGPRKLLQTIFDE
ncbi:MAG: DUF512 domain-containing protein [Clostridia bacterium]|nr:DUF512 domain-containing protein [Clostridia bacterium]MDQ7791769.1 DUF512 domain-containing protein [Clostridia bacterium]